VTYQPGFRGSARTRPAPRLASTLKGVSNAEKHPLGHELVVAADGSIPADQLAKLGVGPGQHLRVVPTPARSADGNSLGGSVPDLGDLTWDDFKRGSELASSDLGLA
jgi:hypothetical protein